jgi:hypothetical protein
MACGKLPSVAGLRFSGSVDHAPIVTAPDLVVDIIREAIGSVRLIAVVLYAPGAPFTKLEQTQRS